MLKLETILNEYFQSQKLIENGIPSVHYLVDQLHISTGYLSDILRSLIGQSAQQYIHFTLIERAKERLSTTQLSVSEIAFELGLEYLPSFSKFFKTKAQLSPLFRVSGEVELGRKQTYP